MCLIEDTAVFIFNDTATTEIYTLSLHDALPISRALDTSRAARSWTAVGAAQSSGTGGRTARPRSSALRADRKSTRLNFSHANISYDLFCLQKKMKTYGLFSNLTHDFLPISV